MGCLICSRIDQVRRNTNRNFVAELETGFVVLGDFQLFHGYSLVLAKQHASELHELPSPEREQFLIEMSYVAQAVYIAFTPVKLNYECLGNTEPHLHWHIFPRHHNDLSPGTSSWIIDRTIRYSEKYKLADEELTSMKSDLLDALESIKGVSILSTWKSKPNKLST